MNPPPNRSSEYILKNVNMESNDPIQLLCMNISWLRCAVIGRIKQMTENHTAHLNVLATSDEIGDHSDHCNHVSGAKGQLNEKQTHEESERRILVERSTEMNMRVNIYPQSSVVWTVEIKDLHNFIWMIPLRCIRIAREQIVNADNKRKENVETGRWN